MARKLFRPSMFVLIALAVLATALPASAQIYVVTLKNGNTIETARQPEQASWDSGTILVLSEVGNWIGVARNQIKIVEERSQIRGFGHRINSTTIALGESPNDLPDGTATQDPSAVYAQMLDKLLNQRDAASNYSVKQGVQTEDMGGGIPLNALGLGTFPVGAPPPPAPQGNSGATAAPSPNGSSAPIQ